VLRRLMMLALLAGAVVVLREIAPEVRRYLNLKRM
jgi:hypothetical protein